jgi:hypothetical protein
VTTFDKVQNVNYKIPNPLATLLDYGTVSIYTAGGEGKLDFTSVKSPKKVQTEVFRRLTAYQTRQRRQELDDQQSDLPIWFSVYEERRRVRAQGGG